MITLSTAQVVCVVLITCAIAVVAYFLGAVSDTGSVAGLVKGRVRILVDVEEPTSAYRRAYDADPVAEAAYRELLAERVVTEVGRLVMAAPPEGVWHLVEFWPDPNEEEVVEAHTHVGRGFITEDDIRERVDRNRRQNA